MLGFQSDIRIIDHDVGVKWLVEQGALAPIYQNEDK